MSDQKTSVFHADSVLSRLFFVEPYRGVRPSFNSSQAANAGAEFMPFPRMDNSPAHTPRVWTALRVRELPTLETDAFRVQNAMRFTHSSCPGLRRFFKKFPLQNSRAAASPLAGR